MKIDSDKKSLLKRLNQVLSLWSPEIKHNTHSHKMKHIISSHLKQNANTTLYQIYTANDSSPVNVTGVQK